MPPSQRSVRQVRRNEWTVILGLSISAAKHLPEGVIDRPFGHGVAPAVEEEVLAAGALGRSLRSC